MKHGQASEDDRGFWIMDGLNGQVFDVLDQVRVDLVYVVEDLVALLPDNGSRMLH